MSGGRTIAVITAPDGTVIRRPIGLGQIRRWEREHKQGLQPLVEDGYTGWVAEAAYLDWRRRDNDGDDYENELGAGVDAWLDDFEVEVERETDEADGENPTDGPADQAPPTDS